MNSVLLKGACDIDALNFYIKPQPHCKLFKEGSVQTKQHGVFYCTAHSEILCRLGNSYDSKFIDNDFYKSLLVTKRFNLVIISVLAECCYGVYENKNDSLRIIYGEHDLNAFTNKDDYIKNKVCFGFSNLNKDDYKRFETEWDFVGQNPLNQTLINFSKFINSFNKDTNICILLGPLIHDEINETSRPFINADTYFDKLNSALIKRFECYENVSFINPNKYLEKHFKGEYFFYNCQSIVHYKRRVYYEIAKELHKMYPKYIKATYIREFKRRINHIIG